MAEAVSEHPLDLANPDGHSRQLGREWVDLDSEQVLWSDLREFLRDAQHQRAPLDRVVFEVLEELQRDVEEVAAAAGRVEDADGAQPFEEGAEDALGVLVGWRSSGHLAAGHHEWRDLRLSLGPVPAQWGHQDGLNKPKDRGSVCVVGAELRSLIGIEAALEQSPEDGRLDLAPIELRYPADRLHLRRRQGNHLGVIEEAAVEPLDTLDTEQAAAFGHLAEEIVQGGGEGGGVSLGRA